MQAATTCMIDLPPILQAAVGLIAALVTAFLIPFIRSKISAEKQAELVTWVSIAVTAAEQLYTGSGRGGEKRAYVMEFWEEKGYIVDTDAVSDAVNALIEAVVYDLKN